MVPQGGSVFGRSHKQPDTIKRHAFKSSEEEVKEGKMVPGNP